MPNLRVIHDNVADRAAISASSTAGLMVAAHLLNDIKTLAHRSIGTTVTYVLTWPHHETVGGLGLPATNLTADGLIRVRGFDAEAGGSLLVDTGEQFAAAGPALDIWDWTQPLNANAFAYGGLVKVSAWLPDHVAVRRLEITLSDPTNPAGFIDCARIVAGGYWSPEYNASYGLTQGQSDMTTSTRADSGDLRVDRGAQFDTLDFDLEWLKPADRARMTQILRGTAGGRKAFVSVFPNHGDPLLEQDHMIYGGLAVSGIVAAAYRAYSTKIQLQGW